MKFSQKCSLYLLPSLKVNQTQYCSDGFRSLPRKSISFWFEIEVKTAPLCWHISMAVERFTDLIFGWKHFDSNRIQLLEAETAKNDGKMKMTSSKKN